MTLAIATFLHDRVGTFVVYIYYIKLKSCLSISLSVCLSVRLCHAANSVIISAWIGSGLGLCDSCVPGHEQVCFFKSVSVLCWAHKRLKGTAVAPFYHV